MALQPGTDGGIGGGEPLRLVGDPMRVGAQPDDGDEPGHGRGSQPAAVSACARNLTPACRTEPALPRLFGTGRV